MSFHSSSTNSSDSEPQIRKVLNYTLRLDRNSKACFWRIFPNTRCIWRGILHAVLTKLQWSILRVSKLCTWTV